MKRICYLLICMIAMILSSCNDFTNEDLCGAWYCIGDTPDKERTGFTMISFNEDNEISMYFPNRTFFGRYEIHDKDIFCGFKNATERCRLEVITFDKDYTNESLHNAHGRMYLKMYLDDVLFMDFDCVKQFE